MYGGKIDSTGNVSTQLWAFHVQNQTWVLLSPRAKEQYAVVGHTAHVVPPLADQEEGGGAGGAIMLVLFGHCPLYGYISQVQEYDIGGWSAVGGGRGGGPLWEGVHCGRGVGRGLLPERDGGSGTGEDSPS